MLDSYTDNSEPPSSTFDRDIESFLSILPNSIQQSLYPHDLPNNLIEVILDLGRRPLARFIDIEIELSETNVTPMDISYITERIGDFGEDNRAGIEQSLHRISALRNRGGKIIGLTCRVGRAVMGTIKIIEDLIYSGQSLLIIGKPGIGKTTMLREMARVLANEANRRVIIVDTSNEIAGDGDIPHVAIGKARRLQVPKPHLQHQVMIEAVENHMPEVILIDEMGTELEAAAARTIAERGVQLIATAHGNTLQNLMLNPTLSDLVGGIQTVTLGDQEARRRRGQKTVLERKGPPSFPILIELAARHEVAIHRDVAGTIDRLLRGIVPTPELRQIDSTGIISRSQIGFQDTLPAPKDSLQHSEGNKRAFHETPYRPDPLNYQTETGHPTTTIFDESSTQMSATANDETEPLVTRVLPYGVGVARVRDFLARNPTNIELVDDIKKTDVLLTTKTQYRKRSTILQHAQERGVPIYVLRKNTETQLEQFLRNLSSSRSSQAGIQNALSDVTSAVDKVTEGAFEVELEPQNAYIRRLQHILASQSNVNSKSKGRDPKRRVTLYQ
jgi:stage III sporulation protein SpoIIIAA